MTRLPTFARSPRYFAAGWPLLFSPKAVSSHAHPTLSSRGRPSPRPCICINLHASCTQQSLAACQRILSIPRASSHVTSGRPWSLLHCLSHLETTPHSPDPNTFFWAHGLSSTYLVNTTLLINAPCSNVHNVDTTAGSVQSGLAIFRLRENTRDITILL